MADDAKPIGARELAARLGITLLKFYRTRDRLHLFEGLPRPLPQGGRLRFHRATIDDYLQAIQRSRRTGARQRGLRPALEPKPDCPPSEHEARPQ